MCLNTPKLGFVGLISEENTVEENTTENINDNEDDNWLFKNKQEEVDDEDSECENINQDFKVDKCMEEKTKEEDPEYKETHRRDTQEEIIERSEILSCKNHDRVGSTKAKTRKMDGDMEQRSMEETIELEKNLKKQTEMWDHIKRRSTSIWSLDDGSASAIYANTIVEGIAESAIEKSKTSRATCKSCNQKTTKGEVRISTTADPDNPWFHGTMVACQMFSRDGLVYLCNGQNVLLGQLDC
eukprot:Gb_10480 [translate_table: standard]